MKPFKVSSIFFPLPLTLIVGVLVWKNYVPGTWLSGWDTLHPEFNLGLAFKRAFFGVWQEHQGVGAVASQAHAAELPRLAVVWLLSLFLPQSLIRYTFFSLSLLLGTLGVYFISKYFLERDNSHHTKEASFLAAIFYLLNLTTLQHFYVPFEMFAVHFALLPWLFYLAIVFLREGKRRNLIWFSVASLFSASMAHTATLYYVYFASLVLFIFFAGILVRRWDFVKRGVVLTALTFLINSYWMLPNFYFIYRHGKEVGMSKIHTIFSDEAFLQGKAFGDIKDLALQKNFLFNWREFDTKNNTFVDLLDEWKVHLARPYVEVLGYTLLAFAVLGLAISLFRKSKYVFALFPLFLVAAFFWMNANAPFAGIFDLLRERYELFREGLRFPFTKFSILLTFILSLYLSFFFQFALEIFKKLKLSYLFLTLVVAGNIYFMWPAFEGYLISPSMKVKIPTAYFEVFDWFEKQGSEGRVAKLPLYTFWGWNFYSWDYQGAGFTWFGISQPTFDREFDRWSPYNESFYNEAAFALYANDNEAFEKVLQKYQVKYLLLDESVLNAGGNSKLLFIPEIKKSLSQIGASEVAKSNFLTIYETDLGSFAPESFVRVNADSTYSQVDPIFQKYGDYIEDSKETSFPFVNLDKRAGVRIKVEEGSLVFEKGKAKVTLPAKDKIIEDFSQDRGFPEAYNCDIKKIGSVSKNNTRDRIIYKAVGGGVSCDFLSYPTLPYSQAYILRIKGENKTGRSLKIYLQNSLTNRMDLEELLPNGQFDESYVVLPKTLVEGSGYTLNLETRSFGRIASENVLERVEIIPFDYNFLTQVYSGTGRVGSSIHKIRTININKNNPFLYTVDVEGGGLIIIDTGYEPGWMSYPTLEHVKVNSWANGFIVKNGQKDARQFIIFFWPQILEYLGFGLAITGFLTIFLLKFKKHG